MKGKIVIAILILTAQMAFCQSKLIHSLGPYFNFSYQGIEYNSSDGSSNSNDSWGTGIGLAYRLTIPFHEYFAVSLNPCLGTSKVWLQDAETFRGFSFHLNATVDYAVFGSFSEPHSEYGLGLGLHYIPNKKTELAGSFIIGPQISAFGFPRFGKQRMAIRISNSFGLNPTRLDASETKTWGIKLVTMASFLFRIGSNE